MTALSFFPLSNIKIIISDKMEMFRARARWLHWHKNWKQLFPSLTFLVTWNILQKNRNNNNCRHGWVLVKTRHLLLLQPPLIDFYLTDGSWTKNTHHTLCNLWITTAYRISDWSTRYCLVFGSHKDKARSTRSTLLLCCICMDNNIAVLGCSGSSLH